MSDEVGSVSLGLEADASGLEKEIEAAAKKSSDTLSKAFDETGKKIEQILSDSEKSMKSKAASIAAIYKKQGLSSSEAMKRAWAQIERECGTATGKASQHLLDFGSDAENASNRVVAAFKKIGGALVAAISVKALVSFGKQCIELGSDLAEVQNVVDVTFATMSDKVNQFAQSAAATYGLSETMAKKFTGTFGSMAEAFGFSEQAAYEMSTTLAGLAGDVASFYNITQDEAYTKLKSVFSGETETLKDLGIVMTQSALDAYALANGYGKTTSAMTEMEKVSLRYAFVQSQLTNATGDFWRTQDSWANQSRLLALQAQSAMAAVGQGLINLLRPALVALNSVMTKIVQLAGAFRDLTALLFGDSGSSTTSAVASDLGAASSNADALTSGLDNASSAAKTLKRQLMGFDQINKLSDNSSTDTGNSGSSGSTAASSIPLLSALEAQSSAAESSVSGLSGTVQKLKDWLDSIDTQPLTDGLEHLKTSAGNLGETLRGGLQWGLENVLAPLAKWTIEEAAPRLVEALASALDVLNDVILIAQPALMWLWDTFLQPLADAAGNEFTEALDALNGELVWLHEALQDVIAVMNGEMTFGEMLEKWLSPEGLEDTKTKLSGILDLAGKLATYATTPTQIAVDIAAVGVDGLDQWLSEHSETYVSIKALFSDTKDALSQKWTELTSGVSDKAVEIKAVITQKWNDLKSKWSSITDPVKDKIATFKGQITQKWASLKPKWDAIVGNIQDKTAAMKAEIKTKWSDLKQSWKDLLANFQDKTVNVSLKIAATVNDIKKWFNTNVIDKVNNAIHKVPLLAGVSIPHLAQGGYVRANDPQLAVIGDNPHQGEIVAPEGKLQAMANQAAAGVSASILSALAKAKPVIDAGTLIRKSTPCLANTPASTQWVPRSEGDPEHLADVEELLREILALLRTLDVVELDPESLRQYFIRKTNARTKATGTCELMV